MFDKMDKLYMDTRARGTCFLRHLKSEERGASDIVAIIAIIVIVLAVAVIFREKLTDVVTKAFDNVTTWIGTGETGGAGAGAGAGAGGGN